MKITQIAKQILQPLLVENAVVADFTLGNAQDSVFMLKHPIGKLYAFEIQKEVYQRACLLIQDERARLINDGHEQVLTYIQQPIDAGIFNFGYCPSGDTTITTMMETSKKAVMDALSLLKVNGKLVLVVYVGHDEGKKEATFFVQWSKTLPSKQYNVMKISMENKIACPFIIVIEKVR